MTHINPDGKAVGGPQPQVKRLLHIYSQPCEHFEARVVGNCAGLEILKQTIEDALAGKVKELGDGMTYAISSEEIFATDGEGYDVIVKVLPDSDKKIPMVDNVWERFPPHYCDRGYADDTHI